MKLTNDSKLGEDDGGVSNGDMVSVRLGGGVRTDVKVPGGRRAG